MAMSRRNLIAAPRAWPQTTQPEPLATASTRTALRTRSAGQFTDDFDETLDRRLIRFVVP